MEQGYKLKHPLERRNATHTRLTVRRGGTGQWGDEQWRDEVGHESCRFCRETCVVGTLLSSALALLLREGLLDSGPLSSPTPSARVGIHAGVAEDIVGCRLKFSDSKVAFYLGVDSCLHRLVLKLQRDRLVLGGAVVSRLRINASPSLAVLFSL